jgi:hypothetical protein
MMTPAQCEFSFSKTLPDVNRQTCSTSANSPPSSSAEYAKVIAASTQTVSDEFEVDSNLPAIPNPPLSAPSVKLPGSYPADCEDTDVLPQTSSLQDLSIPSPLLYHEKSREDLLGLHEDDGNLSNIDAPLICARDTPDPDFKSLKLGSPVQPPRDKCRSHNSNDTQSGRGNQDCSTFHDPLFYQRTRTYLTSPSERIGRCSTMAPSRFDDPIVTTKNTLRRRQTHIYPGEFAITPPATVPSSRLAAPHSPCGMVEQACSVVATAGNGCGSWTHKDQPYPHAGLNVTPPRSCELLSPVPSTMAAHDERNSGTKGSSVNVPSMSCSVPMIDFKNDNERSVAKQEILTRSISAPANHGNSNSSSNCSITSQSLGSNKLSKLDDRKFSTLRRFSRVEGHPAAATAVLSNSTGAPPKQSTTIPQSPVDPIFGSTTTSQPSSDPGIVEIQVCPTPNCGALVLLAPTQNKHNLHQDKSTNFRLGKNGKVVEIALEKLFKNLGFELMHGEGCNFGLDSHGKSGKEEDIEGTAGFETHLREGTRGSEKRTPGGYQDASASAPAVAAEMEMDIEMVEKVKGSSGHEDYDDLENGCGDDWVGEGEGREFWV